MRAGRALIALLAGCLMVAGAAGLASLRDDDYCSPSEELGDAQWKVLAWPPGVGCEQTFADGTRQTEEPSTPAFLLVLGGMALTGVAVVRNRRRVPAPVRLTAAAAVALAWMGVGGLEGGYQLGVMVGLVLGVPSAYAIDRWARGSEAPATPRDAGLLGAAVGSGAVLLDAFFDLLVGGAAPFLLSLGLIALAASYGRRSVLQRAR